MNFIRDYHFAVEFGVGSVRYIDRGCFAPPSVSARVAEAAALLSFQREVHSNALGSPDRPSSQLIFRSPERERERAEKEKRAQEARELLYREEEMAAQRDKEAVVESGEQEHAVKILLSPARANWNKVRRSVKMVPVSAKKQRVCLFYLFIYSCFLVAHFIIQYHFVICSILVLGAASIGET